MVFMLRIAGADDNASAGGALRLIPGISHAIPRAPLDRPSAISSSMRVALFSVYISVEIKASRDLFLSRSPTRAPLLLPSLHTSSAPSPTRHAAAISHYPGASRSTTSRRMRVSPSSASSSSLVSDTYTVALARDNSGEHSVSAFLFLNLLSYAHWFC